jgi:hypothetical protein
MHRKIYKHVLPCLIIVLLGAMVQVSCNRKPVQWQPKVTTLSAPPPLVWTVTVAPQDSKVDSIYFQKYPEDKIVYSAPASEILSYWGTGFLSKGEKGFEWRDYDPGAGIFNPNPKLDLTSWDIPLSVDPANQVIVAFGNDVLPNRKLQIHYLNGTAPLLIAEIQAADFEALTPLPTDTWTIFYTDKPADATATKDKTQDKGKDQTKDKTVADEPAGRRVRLYGEATFAGEQKDVLNVYPMSDAVAIEKKDGWTIFQKGGAIGSNLRTMSLSLIPDHPVPIAKSGELILISSEKKSDDGKSIASSILYSYGAFTRLVEKVWDPSTTGSAQRILSIAIQGPNDYYIVLGSLPDEKKLTLGHLKDGKWEELAKIDLPNKITRTEIFLASQAPGTTEATQVSGAETESVVSTEGSVANVEGAVGQSKDGVSIR